MRQVGTSWSRWTSGTLRWMGSSDLSGTSGTRRKGSSDFWDKWDKDKGSVHLNHSTCPKWGLQGKETLLVYRNMKIQIRRVFATLMRPIVRNIEFRVRPIGFYNTCWCDPLFFTAPPILSKPDWLNGSKGREFNLGFRNSVFWFPGIIKWKRP